MVNVKSLCVQTPCVSVLLTLFTRGCFVQ